MQPMLIGALIGALIYLAIPPLVLRAISEIHLRQIIYKREEKNRAKKKMGRKQKKVPQELRTIYSKRLKFAKRDDRDIQFRKPQESKKEGEAPPASTIPISAKKMMRILFYAGLIVSIVACAMKWYLLILLAFFIWIIRFVVGMKTSKKAVAVIDRKMATMYGIAQSYLKYTTDETPETSQKINIEEWQDVTTPKVVRFELGANLSESVKQPFMEAFNLYFGQEQTWVESFDKEKGHEGWNFGEGLLHIYAVPPLPRKAPFMEHYVIGDGVAWSYFPLGVGVEGGIVMTNPETNEEEHVIGFDLSGLAVDEAEKFGLKADNGIVAAPQVLIAGRTGGGKAIAITELVEVIERASDTNECAESNVNVETFEHPHGYWAGV